MLITIMDFQKADSVPNLATSSLFLPHWTLLAFLGHRAAPRAQHRASPPPAAGIYCAGHRALFPALCAVWGAVWGSSLCCAGKGVIRLKEVLDVSDVRNLLKRSPEAAATGALTWRGEDIFPSLPFPNLKGTEKKNVYMDVWLGHLVVQ